MRVSGGTPLAYHGDLVRTLGAACLRQKSRSCLSGETAQVGIRALPDMHHDEGIGHGMRNGAAREGTSWKQIVVDNWGFPKSSPVRICYFTGEGN